jgi:phosphatidylserine/phosphatidylglycerophosphate/cardiolipin synthase-like enzyme
VLHAKVAIADTSRALIGSANLTEAALQRNIEIGLLLSTPAPIASVRAHFEALIHNGVLVQVPL